MSNRPSRYVIVAGRYVDTPQDSLGRFYVVDLDAGFQADNHGHKTRELAKEALRLRRLADRQLARTQVPS